MQAQNLFDTPATIEEAKKAQPQERADICRNRHRGNQRSVEAFESNQAHFTKQERRILDLLAQSQAEGLIAHEAAGLLKIPIASASARFSELKAKEAIVASNLRRSTQYGNMADVCVLPEFLDEANRRAEESN